MVTRFDVHLKISAIQGKILFQFQFPAHFFALRITDTRLKIFPTAQKKVRPSGGKSLTPIIPNKKDREKSFMCMRARRGKVAGGLSSRYKHTTFFLLLALRVTATLEIQSDCKNALDFDQNLPNFCQKVEG